MTDSTPRDAAAAPPLHDEVRDLWEQKAAYWDEQMGDGNLWQRELIIPATERLLAVQPGETVLDVACGNGIFARRLAAAGAHVVAGDFSATFLDRARARATPESHRIEYRLLDATKRDQLDALGRHRFDAALCSMALMDIVDIEPLLAALPALLKPGGRFVFSVPHPCFHSSGVQHVAEQFDLDGQIVVRTAVKVTHYLDLAPQRGAGMPGEPNPHYYFDRPLSVLLGAAFRAGLVLDGLAEPSFTQASNPNPLSFANMPQIPPILVGRLRPAR